MAARKLTKDGYQRLQKEADDLLHKERPKVVKGVSDAAAEGDRSENAEYIYGKKKLREIDKRLQYLSGLLKNVTVVDPVTLSGDRVQFGATVTIEDEDGETKVWTIVGEGEADSKRGTISERAPVAKALMGKTVGDLVTVVRPKGEAEFEIRDLAYGGRSYKDTP